MSSNDLQALFMPHAFRRMSEFNTGNHRFVHYTSADAALSIIQNKEIWLRNVTVMNDFSEIEYGLRCLQASWAGENGIRLRSELNGVHPNLADKIAEQFNNFLFNLRHDTYVSCLSEHSDKEDKVGRLSMWRAYGSSGGIALVLNRSPFFAETDALHAYTSPVAYLSGEEFDLAFAEIADLASSNLRVLKAYSVETIINTIFNAFRFAVVSTKHPGFAEEREWRVVYSPTINASNLIQEIVVSVRGVPQKIYKIPLTDVPERGLFGIELPRLIERIIIGPTQYKSASYFAFVAALASAGVENPEHLVFTSNIPVR